MLDENFLDLAKNWLFDGGRWFLYLLAAAFLTFIAKFLLNFVTRRLKIISRKTDHKIDDILVSVLQKTQSWVIFIWILFPIISDFAQAHQFHAALKFILVLSTSIQAAMWGLSGIGAWRKSFLEKKMQDDVSSAAALNLIYISMQALFIVVLVLMSLSHLGINVSALLAGLGIGGIAVALATQNILGDLFASLMIVLDRPFVIGDYIVVGTEKGTVEKVGLKTTRLRSLSGEQLIFSNKDLLDSRVRNFKRMDQRRCEQIIGVAYETTSDQLRKIPQWIKEIIDLDPLLKFDRCNLIRFGASSLDFEIVAWMLDSDFNRFAETQHQLLIRIFEKFQKEGINIPFPVTTVMLQDAQKLNSAYKAP